MFFCIETWAKTKLHNWRAPKANGEQMQQKPMPAAMPMPTETAPAMEGSGMDS